MAAGIIDAICTFVASNAYGGIGCTVWDGEVHRYDANGKSISPSASAGRSGFPPIKFSMPATGFKRSWTFEEPYYDEGMVVCQIWHTQRDQAEQTMDMVEALLGTLDAWTAIGALIPSPYAYAPHYVIQLLLTDWASYQVEGFRTQSGELLYTCELYYKTTIHGALPFQLAAPGAAPLQIPGLTLWLKADVGAYTDAGITLATDGQTVQQWNDQSGNRTLATQATPSARPTFKTSVQNGLPVIRNVKANGTDLSIGGALTALTAAEVFIVLASPSTSVSNGLWTMGTGGDTGFYYFSDGNIYDSFGSNVRYGPITPVASPLGFHELNITAQAGSWVLRQDQNVLSTQGTNTVAWAATGLIGASSAAAGSDDIGEIIVYNRALLASERTQIHNYLRSRWGTP